MQHNERGPNTAIRLHMDEEDEDYSALTFALIDSCLATTCVITSAKRCLLWAIRVGCIALVSSTIELIGIDAARRTSLMIYMASLMLLLLDPVTIPLQ